MRNNIKPIVVKLSMFPRTRILHIAQEMKREGTHACDTWYADICFHHTVTHANNEINGIRSQSTKKHSVLDFSKNQETQF